MADQLNGNQLTYVDVKFDVPCGSKSERKTKELRLEVEGGWKVDCGKGRVRPLPYQAEKEREVIILTL